MDNNRTQNGLDCNLIFAQNMESYDLKVILNSYPKNMRRWTVFKVQTNGCDFFQIIHRQKMFQILVNTMMRHLNVKDIRCPLKKASEMLK